MTRPHGSTEPGMLTGALVLGALGLFVYWPALNGGFIFDDEVLLSRSELIRAADGLYRFWFTTEAHDYWPVTNTSLWLEWRLWGLDPTGYHWTNLLLHIANAILAWRLLRTVGVAGAFLGAALFLVHPVNVESVAWIAQRKNTLSMFFFLLSALTYERAGDRRGLYVTSVGLFVLAMLSKGSVVVLPPLLLLVAWWSRGGVSRHDLLRTAPFFLIGVVLTVVNIWFQAEGDATRDVTWIQRTLGAGAVLWFYWVKAVLPVGLSFVYPQWHIDATSVRWWLPLAAAAAVTGWLLWNYRAPRLRPFLFAWLFVAVALVPVMGFTDVYFMKFSLVADHYQYIAVLGVCGLAGAGVSLLIGHLAGQGAVPPAPARSASRRRR
jgi:hypothetical protein